MIHRGHPLTAYRQRGNLFLLPPLSQPHHDSRPRRHGCRRVRAVRQRSQLFPVIRFQLHAIIKHEIRNYVKLIESRDTRRAGVEPMTFIQVSHGLVWRPTGAPTR